MANSAFASDILRSFIERIERLSEEKDGISADISEIYKEAKGSGFDVAVMRKVVALRKMDRADRQEMEAILDLYKSALGMLADTPLGEAAIRVQKCRAQRRARLWRRWNGNLNPKKSDGLDLGVDGAFDARADAEPTPHQTAGGTIPGQFTTNGKSNFRAL